MNDIIRSTMNFIHLILLFDIPLKINENNSAPEKIRGFFIY